jgi:hypothetical protein
MHKCDSIELKDRLVHAQRDLVPLRVSDVWAHAFTLKALSGPVQEFGDSVKSITVKVAYNIPRNVAT